MTKYWAVSISIALALGCSGARSGTSSEGLATPQKIFYAPISVLRGMVRLFFVLMLLEAAALALLYV